MACHDMAYPLLIFYRNGWPVPVTISAIQSNSFWGAMRAASLKVMGLGEDNNCSHFGWVFCFVIFSAQYLNLFRHRVLTGSWARQLFCLRAPGMLSLSCRLTVLLLGGGYYLWLCFFLKFILWLLSYKLACKWLGCTEVCYPLHHTLLY